MTSLLKKELFRMKSVPFLYSRPLWAGIWFYNRTISYPVFRFYDLFCCASYRRL